MTIKVTKIENEEEVEEAIDMFGNVQEFGAKFEIPVVVEPGFLEDTMMHHRIAFMKEELDEIIKANYADNLEDFADGLVDLVYVILGTADMMNLPWYELWEAVHKANMKKKKSSHPSESKRNMPNDVVKPEGWIHANLYEILEKYRENMLKANEDNKDNEDTGE